MPWEPSCAVEVVELVIVLPHPKHTNAEKEISSMDTAENAPWFCLLKQQQTGKRSWARPFPPPTVGQNILPPHSALQKGRYTIEHQQQAKGNTTVLSVKQTEPGSCWTSYYTTVSYYTGNGKVWFDRLTAIRNLKPGFWNRRLVWKKRRCPIFSTCLLHSVYFKMLIQTEYLRVRDKSKARISEVACYDTLCSLHVPWNFLVDSEVLSEADHLLSTLCVVGTCGGIELLLNSWARLCINAFGYIVEYI